jgi:phosphoglycerate dehydrogenase-like enzyme
MRLLVHHGRFGPEIASALSAAFPSVAVTLEVDEARVAADVDAYDAIVGLRFPPGMLGRAHRLRWLQLTGVGADHLEPVAPEVIVTHAGSVPARAVAEFVCMGALMVTWGQLGVEGRSSPPRCLNGGTLTVLGLGRIGLAVAARARALGMHVIGVTHSPRVVDDVEVMTGREGLLAAAALSDVLVIAIPRAADTESIVDRAVIAALPPHAVLVNVARAEVLDEVALCDALREGHLGGALLDVHRREPVPPDAPLWDVPRLWLSPHCAYRYQDHPADVAALCVENLHRFLAQRPLLNVALAVERA